MLKDRCLFIQGFFISVRKGFHNSMGTENGQGKFPVCHQDRFTQNSDGWTVVKVTLELKFAKLNLIHSGRVS